MALKPYLYLVKARCTIQIVGPPLLPRCPAGRVTGFRNARERVTQLGLFNVPRSERDVLRSEVTCETVGLPYERKSVYRKYGNGGND
jgi:hypothetical protein